MCANDPDIVGATLHMTSTSTRLGANPEECDVDAFSDSYSESFVLDPEYMAQCEDEKAVEESKTLQNYCEAIHYNE